MQIEELRLGNLVEANIKGDDGIKKWEIIKVSGIQKSFNEDEPDKVYFIEPDRATFSTWRLFTTTENDCLRPVPLTEEWLMKFGFEKDDTGVDVFDQDYHEWYQKDFPIIGVLCQSSDKSYLFDENTDTLRIYFVHQLQNLYYALTGEELTFKTN